MSLCNRVSLKTRTCVRFMTKMLRQMSVYTNNGEMSISQQMLVSLGANFTMRLSVCIDSYRVASFVSLREKISS